MHYGLKTIAGVALACAMALPAHAASLIVSNGILMGATGVTVGANVYDVSFVEGSCVTVYGSCELSSFDFTTSASAILAANALNDQVLVDGPDGNFDSSPQLTYGCTGSTSSCYVMFAYTRDQNWVATKGPRNTSAGSDSILSNGTRGFLTNSANSETEVWARFTPAASAVPEPSTWGMMVLGFGAVGFGLRRRSAKGLPDLS